MENEGAEVGVETTEVSLEASAAREMAAVFEVTRRCPLDSYARLRDGTKGMLYAVGWDRGVLYAWTDGRARVRADEITGRA